MSDVSGKAHRESVYTTEGANEVSSFQEYLAPSLQVERIDTAYL
jgi:hypothetical protein